MKVSPIVIEREKVRKMIYILALCFIGIKILNYYYGNQGEVTEKHLGHLLFPIIFLGIFLPASNIEPKEIRSFWFVFVVGMFVASVWNLPLIPLSMAKPLMFIGWIIQVISVFLLVPACGFTSNKKDTIQVEQSNEADDEIVYENSLFNYMATIVIGAPFFTMIFILSSGKEINIKAFIIGGSIGLILFALVLSLSLKRNLKKFSIKLSPAGLSALPFKPNGKVSIDWNEIANYEYKNFLLFWILVIAVKSGERAWIPIWRFDVNRLTEYIESFSKDAVNNIRCPECWKVFTDVPNEWHGKKVRCEVCKNEFRIEKNMETE